MGTEFLAAITVIINLNYMLIMIGYGFGEAIATFIGNSLGEN